jgi:hypothetical protein
MPTLTVPTTIAEIQRRNRDRGSHFFDADTLRFFRSRILPTVHVGATHAYFVTSERYDDDAPRLYTVRSCDVSGDCGTVGEFQGYQTSASAQRAAADAARADVA